METRIRADEVIQVLPGLDGTDFPVNETTRRSAPQSEAVEKSEDHEVERSGQQEDLSRGERESEQGNRQDEGLQEKDAERRGQVREMNVLRPPEGKDRNHREHEREDRFGREENVLDGHHWGPPPTVKGPGVKDSGLILRVSCGGGPQR